MRIGVGFIFLIVVLSLSDAAAQNLVLSKKDQIAFVRAFLKDMSAAAESYAAAHNGQYPAEEKLLTVNYPPYIFYSYCGKTIKDYAFSCSFSVKGYTLTATPQLASQDTIVRSITTGGVESPDPEEVEK